MWRSGPRCPHEIKCPLRIECLYERAPMIYDINNAEGEKLEILFANEEEYAEFKERHALHKVKRVELESYAGNAYLGIDAGSTTTKIALVDEEGSLLYSHYGSNMGNPLESTIDALKNLYAKLNKETRIVQLGRYRLWRASHQSSSESGYRRN